MRIVLDASSALHVVLRTDRASHLVAILQKASLVIAPSLFHAEVANTLWKYVRAGEIDQDTALDRYEEAIAIIDAFGNDDELAMDAISAAIRHNHSVYDMLYLALAMRRGCKLLTQDRRLAKLVTQIDEHLVVPIT